jgi:O-6-methylguanine DNA methyltransferase
MITVTDAGIQSLRLGAEDSCANYTKHKVIDHTIRELTAYFEGDLHQFNLPLDLKGSNFQLAVWNEVLAIPYGSTLSYIDIARKMNNPGAVRAVGTANGTKPIPIIIPCHRVIGNDGNLTGYVYGTNIKRKLLAIENQDRWGVQQGILF